VNKYSIANKHLYEILEDYNDGDIQEKNVIFQTYMKALWKNKNKPQFLKRTISFRILESNLPDEIIEIFKAHNSTKFIYCRTKTKETDHLSLVHQKVNNLYSYYCDKRFCVDKDYFKALKTPKKLYYEYIRSNKKKTPEQLRALIEKSVADSIQCKEKCDKEKLRLTIPEYKNIIDRFMHIIFDNYIEDNTTFELVMANSDISEDNRVVKYICTSLQGYMKNYEKEYYGIKRGNNQTYARCPDCGALFVETKNKRKKRCDVCQNKKRNNIKEGKKQKKKVISKKKTHKYNIDVCQICGCEYIIPYRSKRGKCDSCYEIYRRKRNKR